MWKTFSHYTEINTGFTKPSRVRVFSSTEEQSTVDASKKLQRIDVCVLLFNRGLSSVHTSFLFAVTRQWVLTRRVLPSAGQE